MSKDTFYFSHDYNARNDEKILSLRMSLGWEGYGLYWALIEKLRESKDYTLSLDFNLIAFDLRTDNQKIKSIVTGFGLFSIDEEKGKFYSKSLLNRMQIKESKSQKAREAAHARWNKKPEESAESMQTHSQRIPNEKQGKERKGKEIKVKKSKEDVLKPVDTLFEEYLKNEQTVNAVISNPDNKLKNILHLKKRLEEFVKMLKEKSRHSETMKEFAGYFRHWHKATLKQQGETKNSFYQRIQKI